MRKHLSLIACSLLVSGLSFAQETVEDEQDQSADSVEMTADAATAEIAKKGPCSKLNLDASQKAQMKAAMMGYRTAKIQLVAQAKTARLNYFKTVLDKNATYENGQAAAAAMLNSRTALGAAKVGLGTQVLFQILKADQRQPALACWKSMKKKHKKGGHGHHGGRDGRGGRGDIE